MSVKAQKVLNYNENIENKKFHWNCTVCKCCLENRSLSSSLKCSGMVQRPALVLYHKQVRLWNGFINAVCGQCVELNAVIKFLNDAVLKRAKIPSIESILLQPQLHSAGHRRRTEEHAYQKQFSWVISKVVNATRVPQGSASRTNIGVNLLQLTYHMNH